jgi:Major Facilitator Superfamily
MLPTHWKKTRAAFVWTSILNTPLWAIFNMLPFILYKDLHATPLQVTMIIILKPAVSIFALYWSMLIEKRKDRLISNLIWARAISHVPFFFFPFIDNPWFFIFAFGLYMMLARGTVPAWMEVLKLNIPGVSREKVFAYGSALSYIGGAVIPFALGGIMDTYFESWRWIFPATALISLGAIPFKKRILIKLDGHVENQGPSSISWKQQILKPWKSAWELVQRRPDFTRYQLGFMLGGSGLIIMQPALPVFFVDQLHLTYTDLAVALTLCKGAGFVLTSSAWAKLMGKIDIYRFNSLVTLLAFAFPFCLIAAQWDLSWLFGGYLLYGIMQAGSEMSWNLSGPLFSKDEDSSVYSSLNVMTVGLRGCFVPIIGSLFLYQFDAAAIMLLGSFICLLSAVFMIRYSRQHHIYCKNPQI